MRDKGVQISNRWATLITSLIFIGIGLYVYISTMTFPSYKGVTLGPEFMPQLLASLLIILAILSVLSVWKKPDYKAEIEKPLLLLIIIIVSFLYTLLMAQFNFSILTFLFLFIVFTILRREKGIKIYLQNIICSLLSTTFIYIIFGLALRII